MDSNYHVTCRMQSERLRKEGQAEGRGYGQYKGHDAGGGFGIADYLDAANNTPRYRSSAKSSSMPSTPQEMISPAVTVRKENQTGTMP